MVITYKCKLIFINKYNFFGKRRSTDGILVYQIISICCEILSLYNKNCI